MGLLLPPTWPLSPSSLAQDEPAEADAPEAGAAAASELARLYDALLQRVRALGPAAFWGLSEEEGRPGAAGAEWLALQVGARGLRWGKQGGSCRRGHASRQAAI